MASQTLTAQMRALSPNHALVLVNGKRRHLTSNVGASSGAMAAVPHLRRQGGGRIINIADWVAASGRPRYTGYLPYYVAKAGVVAKLAVKGRDGTWSLLKDEGAEAPRVNKKGERLPLEAVECIWRALRILGELTAAEAAGQAAAGGAPISENGARIYLQGLAQAGYTVRSGGTPGIPASYRLLPARYSGPLHPIYQRSSYEQVYDPNLDKVVWTKGAQPEASELAGLRIENEQLRTMLKMISERGLSPVLTEQELAQIDALIAAGGDE